MMTANMKIEHLPNHIQNKKEVLALIRKYERNPNPYLGYKIAELLGYEPDCKITTEKTTINPDVPTEYYF